MAIPVSELQKINPSSLIELFTLTLNTKLHGNSDGYRFHNGSSPNANGEVVWAGQSYLRYPISCTGFSQEGNSTLPRPRLIISNMLGLFTALMLDTNKVTPGVDLNGATLTRIRTLARYLDAANSSNGVNPYGTPSPSTELPRQVFYLDRKVTETREIVEWECASAFDLAFGPKVPKRLITRTDFPGVGTFVA